MALDQLIGQYPANITLIRYHIPYPGNDPFYNFNPLDDSLRMNYYNVTASSHLFIDGIVDAGYYNSRWDSLFNMRMLIPSPMEIGISGTYNRSNREVNLYIVVTATDSIRWNDIRLQCVTVENHIHWVAPNGLWVHNQVMRGMTPSSHGEPFTIFNGQFVHFNRDFFLRDTLNADSCEFIVFVQADSTKNILQAEAINLRELREVGVWDDSDNLPVALKINSCQPNPFNSSTLIRYSLHEPSNVTINIYSIAGQRVVTLKEGVQQAGEHSVVWDASAFPSGIYLARLEAGGYSQSVKMVLLK